ncbi:MAG: sigma-54-dependent Fis family transcriptional regulator [Deltaproteobacteria bacterium]|nr:sigma-54-dependent Fis family transcriptional regulator [Deltaproteobacteria bacterium]
MAQPVMTSETQQQTPQHKFVYAPNSPIAGIERECAKIAGSDATVLLTGDTGTGKEVLARLVHQRSARAKGPFVAVNCGAIPEALIESELFGHVKGAFTGALNARKGRIGHAQGGTLFLDEIGELPMAMQVKLLRVLQERTYEAVGSSDAVSADFRLIAATNRDLAVEVEAGRFRRDLYYRLLVCPLVLPPLRERVCDIEPLFNHFWRARGEVRAIDAEVSQCLREYAWPGNVRELQNLVERLSVCADGETIRVQDLPPHVRRQPSGLQTAEQRRALMRVVSGEEQNVAPPEIELPVDLPALLRGLEKAYIDAALSRAEGCRKTAADLLGLQRTTLVEKLRRWGNVKPVAAAATTTTGQE